MSERFTRFFASRWGITPPKRLETLTALLTGERQPCCGIGEVVEGEGIEVVV